MYVRGKGIEFSTVSNIINKVSGDLYDGNVIVHPDAGPIKRYSCTYGCGNPSCRAKGSEDGYGFRGRIIGASSDGPGVRRSASGRRGPWACWHAYGESILAIFRVYPHATVTTAQARYVGMRGFLSEFPRTAEANIGSVFAPAYYADLCNCDHDELSVTHNDYRIGA